MFQLWMVLRYLREGKKYLSLTFLLSTLGVALGVAALVIAMSVVSGYETTLRQTVRDAHGDLVVLRRGELLSDRRETEVQVRETMPELVAMTPFALIEALLPGKKKLTGVLVEGVDPGTANMVVNFGRVLTSGAVDFSESDGRPGALLGKGIAKKFDLKVGDEFRVVVPLNREGAPGGFRPKVGKFVVRGILNLGRQDYDDRYILTDLAAAQALGELGERISGWRSRIQDYRQAEAVQKRLEQKLGPGFRVMTWRDANHNLFQAVRYEKVAIFIIVFLMVIAAAFNISSTLFVNVVRRYREISILKAMGASEVFIRGLFSIQGMVVGAIGSLAGIALGYGGSKLFLAAQSVWGLFPGEVYKLDHVEVEIRILDLVIIVIATMCVCYVATWAPARRGGRLSPTEGIRYE